MGTHPHRPAGRFAGVHVAAACLFAWVHVGAARLFAWVPVGAARLFARSLHSRNLLGWRL
jgi:hypothetical protein